MADLVTERELIFSLVFVAILVIYIMMQVVESKRASNVTMLIKIAAIERSIDEKLLALEEAIELFNYGDVREAAVLLHNFNMKLRRSRDQKPVDKGKNET